VRFGHHLRELVGSELGGAAGCHAVCVARR
jgi:hypothetical protein